ncbi:MAG: hypothetical protein JSW11_12340 [Candidatus Heimdallarchaeota archaeon]|nr:MAG: hypothetical protein JSW11_12340 [Candidatus Heimdallarchaeota archaeon]
MSGYAHFVIITLTLLLLASPTISIEGVQSEWSSSITVKRFRWKALKSELRDLDTQEQYRENYLIGGINIPGGINTIALRAIPPNDFDFFNGSRLDLSVTIEGDISLDPLPQNGSDYHLLLLPIKIDNKSFFEVLFAKTGLLENLTHSIFLNSSITDTIARSSLKYNGVLDILYEWDITTGLLVRKEVTAPSGLQLIIVPTSEISVPGWNLPIVLLTVLIINWWHKKRKKD